MDLKINCLVVDDEPLARELMKMFISKISYLNLIAVCENAFDAIEIMQQQTIDLLVTDIQMPQINGLELIKSLQPSPFVILATAFSNYAIEGFDIGVIDYILKPISFDRFIKAVNKAKVSIEQKRIAPVVAVPIQQATHIFVKDGYRLTKIQFNDILYIEGMKDYIKIVTVQKNIVTYMRMKNIEEALPNTIFIRVHKSHIVNTAAIKSIMGNAVELINNESIIISKQHKIELIERLGIKGSEK